MKMSAKRKTPQPVHNRVVQNLNSTTMFGRQGSASRLRPNSNSKTQQSFLDNSVAAPLGGPIIKGHLSTANFPAVDHELECSLVYNEYLQALMKKQIVSNIIKKHEQDLKDQLALQNDDLHKSKVIFKEKQQEVESLQWLKEARDLLKSVESNIEAFSQLTVANDFEDTINQFLDILDTFTKKVHVKDIKPVRSQESFDKLHLLAQQCIQILKRINCTNQHINLINTLATLVKQFKEVSVSVAEKQSSISDMYRNGTFNLLKHISAMYAEREKY